MIASNVEVKIEKLHGYLWIKEHWIMSEPDIRDSRLASVCCQLAGKGNFIFSYKMRDHIHGGFDKDAHQVHCENCLAKLGGTLPHKIIPEKLDTFVMPFGKYKGRMLAEIPRDYLGWANQNLDGGIRKRIRIYLGLDDAATGGEK